MDLSNSAVQTQREEKHGKEGKRHGHINFQPVY